MAKFVEKSDSIESQESILKTRKITFQTLISLECKDKKSKKRLYKHKTQINTNISISKELEPKDSIISESSRLDLNDELEGEVVEIYSCHRIETNKEANYSATHSIQSAKIKNFNYAKISTPWRSILEKALIKV